MIDINKKYRTRDGRDVRILCVDAKRINEVIALIKFDSENELLQTYSNNGKANLPYECELDLIEVSNDLKKD
jgi:hypothetical protein